MKCVIQTIALSILIIIILSTSSGFATQTDTPQAESEILQIALFKNGLGYFQQKVICPDDATLFSFTPAAAASHGTFWVSYSNQVRFESLNAKITETETFKTATSIVEVIKANIGHQVTLLVGNETISGRIKFFADNPEPVEPNPYQPGPGGAPEQSRAHIPYYSPANLVIIETEQGDICINPHSVTKAEFPGGSLENSLPEKTKKMVLDVQLAKAADGEPLSISYLAKGITWAPSYIIDISDSEKARLSSKAVVINEAAELDNVTLQLVTGFPNLQLADVLSPLAKKETLAQFLQALNQGQSERRRRGRFENVMTQSPAYSAPAIGGMLPEYGTARPGMIAEDLFFYPVEKVTLGRNETGYYPLFTESVSYEHIYKWDIPDYINEEDRYYYNRSNVQQQDIEEVWHCVRLENKSTLPWTTAPAQIVKAGMILGQDTLKYTPISGENDVRITQAINIKAEQVENEIERKRDAAQMYGRHFDLVTVEGNLSLTNFQDKNVKIEVSKILSGEVKTTQPEAEIKTLARGLKRMNSTRKLTWIIELEPKQSSEITYTYEVYVRR
ncbi:MAG: hypothetical protein PVG93_00930 [Phycisphaerales bacterium]|jgi:hypothetical protein